MYYDDRNLHRRTGFAFFQSSGFSSPEYEVCRKEERQQQRKSRAEREKEIALIMKCFKVDRSTAEELAARKTA